MNRAPKEYHVLTKEGDGTAEVEAVIGQTGSKELAGLHRFFYVSRADQTVVMAEAPDSPIALLLRRMPGWSEPVDPPGEPR